MTVTDPQARLFDPDTSRAAARGEGLGDAAVTVLAALIGGRGVQVIVWKSTRAGRSWLKGEA